ncbi:hypothetical protein [Pseudorhodoferax sp. Leaf265]|uniref:hypothetical protein n=1 Tax=Pseudorhodoferax sp. Leaf265 TaxID=1736315 RepID=UPI0006F53DD0|nr:hypothetical protein [Pseudorhodoferax sp. Leaf265]KQP19287.1 hypothetical protein ASF45_24705 [Pseudorhodoferax sp. Leaf265]
MKQIRISGTGDVVRIEGQRFVCEWMEASLMNRWLLKIRLAEALAAHGEGSHWVEMRDKVLVHEPETA